MQTLKELIEQFDRNLKQYKSTSYKEAQTRADFIDKFFSILGWDICNSAGHSEAYRDCIFEASLKVNGKSKNPDYTFKIGIEPKFFVEAKKPLVDIKHDTNPAFQLRKYGYSASLPLSILTDFEEFTVYDTRIKPKLSDQASVGRVFYCNFKEYEKNWDYIRGTFAKDSILNGSFDEYAKAKKKGTSEVDKEFLKEIESWRDILAKNIALRNKDLNIYDLNQAVQVIIDRIIFLRIAIDRNIEPDDRLSSVIEAQANKATFRNLDRVFLAADKKYNSGLFKRTGDRKFIQEISIDDKPLLDILKNLETSPYAFNVMSIEILGSIYERFLGKTIRLTASHQAKVEEKPEVRKAGGVYYTPKYIVDYIVNNTIGEKLKDKKPENIGSLNVLDPACGSGSFLVNAYEKLLNWHLDQYIQKGKTQQSIKKELIYEVDAKTWRLTIKEKQRILLSHIYGVDIDRQAVEVTKLSLLLKLMEGESSESAGFLFKHSDLQLLPDLSENIKCGNSLISKDFYDDKQMGLFTIDEQIKINTFDWEAEGRYIKEADRWVGRGFPEIMKQGGFDVVIGNPPYVFTRGEGFTENEKSYYYDKFQCSSYQLNTYAMFTEMGFNLLRENGILGFIIPNNWITINTMKTFRDFLLKNTNDLTIINNLYKVFLDANIDTSLIIFNKAEPNKVHLKESEKPNSYSSVKSLPYEVLLKESIIQIKRYKQDEISQIFIEINLSSISLSQVVKVSTGLKAYQIGKGKPAQNAETKLNRKFHSKTKKNNSYKKYVDGKDVKRYFLGWSGEYLSYGDFLAEPRKSVPFHGPRILVRQIPSKMPYSINAIFTEKEFLNDINSMIIFSNNQEIYSQYFILACLNSKLTSVWFYHAFDKFQRGIFPQFKVNELARFPIPKLDLSNPSQKSQHDKIVSLVDQMLATQKKLHETNSPSEKQAYQQQADILDEQIDRLVYELYELTEEEIKVIEGNK